MQNKMRKYIDLAIEETQLKFEGADEFDKLQLLARWEEMHKEDGIDSVTFFARAHALVAAEFLSGMIEAKSSTEKEKIEDYVRESAANMFLLGQLYAEMKAEEAR